MWKILRCFSVVEGVLLLVVEVYVFCGNLYMCYFFIFYLLVFSEKYQVIEVLFKIFVENFFEIYVFYNVAFLFYFKGIDIGI